MISIYFWRCQFEINNRLDSGNCIRIASTPVAAQRGDDGSFLDGWLRRYDGRWL